MKHREGEESKKDGHIMPPSASTGGGGGGGEVTDIQDKTAGEVVAAKATTCEQMVLR